MLHYVAVFHCQKKAHVGTSELQCVAVYCSVLQCVAVCGSVLQCVECVAVCCSVLSYVAECKVNTGCGSVSEVV